MARPRLPDSHHGRAADGLTERCGLGTPARMALTSNARLVLASASLRRRELLARAGLRFAVRPADILETGRSGERPAARAERLARAKALHVARALGAAPPRLVLCRQT